MHVTNSPRYPQSNREAERAGRTMKGLLKRNDDQHIAIMVYRSTLLQNGLSPAEILMGRRLRTDLPIIPIALKPRGSTASPWKGRKVYVVQTSSETSTYDTIHASYQSYNWAIQFQRPKPYRSCSGSNT